MLGFQSQINRHHHHHRHHHRNIDSASCGVSSVFYICVSYGEIYHGAHSMNYSIHASSHYGDGLCHRKGYNIHFPDLCQSPQEYGSIRNVDTGCNNRIHHASFFRKFWLPQVQSPHFPSLFHSVCSNRPRNGLKYCIPDIGAFCNRGRKINCVMRRFFPSSSVGDRPAPRGCTSTPDERKVTTI